MTRMQALRELIAKADRPERTIYEVLRDLFRRFK
jgi:hypothetical protein